MNIRKAQQKDISEILQVVEDSYTPYRNLISDACIPVYSCNEINDLLNETQSDVWVAEKCGRIIGVAAATEFGRSAYHLKMLFVGGDYQHRGAGSRLMDCFEKRGMQRQRLLLTGNYLEWAKWSRDFYIKHHYREYVPGDEENNPALISQTDFLRKIGRLNNGEKHLFWKTGKSDGQ